MLTKQQIEDYLKSGGNKCLYCKSGEIATTQKVQTDSQSAWQEVYCNDCNKYWNDVYKLVGVEEVK